MTHCSLGKAAKLTCSDSDDVRLVEGATGCSGNLEMKHYGLWEPVIDTKDSDWTMWKPDMICQKLNCGSPVSRQITLQQFKETVPLTKISCIKNSPLWKCSTMSDLSFAWKVQITCSGNSVTDSFVSFIRTICDSSF
ncbi:hypothetical protein ATANTOWER_030028 [Ataeniobius toweri]|uniref:SRCR domain-containing protein n=1 Tax=Ataeniobius toweri TaxID=208326 RepID=A0ABU7CLE2_9TELE|nr:hypothetical protein [Ataeniobius toweri]